MKNYARIFTALMFSAALGHAQWTLKLTSNVYLRTWKLDTKATKEEKEIGGATITLFQNGKQVSQTSSGGDGEFSIMVPKEGEFYLTVSYPGCNTKRMAVNTQNVPENVSKDNYKPTFEITGGFIMVKPYPGINYSELSQDLIRVEFIPKRKAFDDTEAGTEKGLGIVSKIYEAEDDLFSRFCSTNKAGDVALAKPDCPLAKTLYEKAIAMIPGEQYPIVQLAKVGLCLKDKELAEKKAAEDADKKAIADAVAKANADKAALIKEEEAKLTKAAKENAAKEAAENAKLAKQKAAEEKAEKDKPAKQKTAQQTPTEKNGTIKAKQKSPAELEAENKAAKQKAGMVNSEKEDRDAMASDAEKAKAKRLEREKAAKEKSQKQKEGLTKSKEEDEAAMREAEAKKEKARVDRDAKENEKKKLAYETRTKGGEGEMGKGDSDHSIPQVLGGGAEKYKEKIKAADDYYKMKRYDEAKEAYKQALNYKPDDAYATSKLEAIEKLKAPK